MTVKHEITPEIIRQITSTMTEETEITMSEIRTIYEAAQEDTFWLVCHAYAYGFYRGQKAREEHRNGKSS